MLKLYKEDCLVAMDRMIEKGIVVDAIITDPPYGTTACRWDSVIPFDAMWLRLNKLIKPNGAIVLFGSEPFSSALRMSNIKNYKYDWKWDKKRGNGHLIAKKRPMQRIEDILVFSTGTVTNGSNRNMPYFPQMEARENKRKFIPNKDSHSEIFNNHKYSKDYKRDDYTHRYPTTVIELSHSDRSKSIHPTQKPVALMEYLIKTYTNEGELVLDFTMGSGTTGVACKNLNRNFIGIEMDSSYYDIAVNRINNT